MLGNFDEIMEQGFNVDEILQQYSKIAAVSKVAKK